MIYVMFLLIAIVSTCAIGFYCNYEGVFESIIPNLPKKKISDDMKPYSKKLVSIILTVIFALTFLAQVSLHKNAEIVGLIKLFVLLLIVFCAGVIDFKRKIIPNILILFGLMFWVGITFFEIFNSDNFKGIMISELIGFAVGFGLLAVVSLITKGAMGFGDVKLFGVIGLIGGAFCTYSTLLVSLIVSVIVSVIGMIRKKIGRKDAIPFGPCIAVGYLIVLFLASY